MNKPTAITRTTKAQGRPEEGDFFEKRPAKLILEDGTSFCGFVPAWQPEGECGEVVFNTGMTGYVETLTDPSYAGQILTFTYPLIGNYGVPAPGTWESAKMHLRGVVISELSQTWSHTTGTRSLLEWLHAEAVPVITGVDTRALTKRIRVHGTMAGIITTSSDPAKADLRLDRKLEPLPFAKVSVARPEVHSPTRPAGAKPQKTVIVVDCGMKSNIQRSLLALGVRVKRVPYNYDYSAEPFDGVLVSNGPGDPADYPETVAVLKKALTLGKPIFGICLGNQLMALAAGAKTYKLLFGHRGHNQPVVTPGNQAYITSQNHSYAIAEASLPTDWEVTFRNLNDNSVEGITHKSKPYFAVQFHPEAAPGPTDTAWLFQDFAGKL